MSGAGRKSQYRKSVTTEYEETDPVPDTENGEEIALISGTRGANIFEIQRHDGKGVGLCLLPNKFKKLIWVKRGDYVIVGSSDSETCLELGVPDDTKAIGIRFMIRYILNKQHIKHLKSINIWPESFSENDANPRKDTGYGVNDTMPPMNDDEEFDEEEEDMEEHIQYDSKGNTITSATVEGDL
jgi:probable RNA-binding protein EIF1AD